MADGVALEDLLHPFLGRYLSAPDWLKSSAGRAYRALPEAVRMGGAYGEFRSQLAAEGGPGPMARLDATLQWALETVPAYAAYRASARGISDPRELLAQLPITDKLDLKRHPERYLSRAMPPAARLETYTGGSTRHPMRFFLQKHVTRPKEQAFMQEIRSQYETQGHPYYATARLWDDGIIDPRDTRMVLALALSATLNAPLEETRFGVFRM